MFADADVIRRVDGENVLLLGGPRALLLQLAHPLVAKAVAEHSGFESDPFARLRRTLEASHAIVFGASQEARAAARGVRRMHARVVGEGYRANDPALLLWVHSTLVDTALRIHRLFLRPLSATEESEYYEQSMRVAELLGVPLSVQPPDLPSFRAYMRETIASLEVSPEARRLAASVLRPPPPSSMPVPVPAFVAEPVFAVVRQLTIGLLPPPVRAGYGFSWDAGRGFALAGAMFASRATLPWVPGAVRRARLRVPA